MENITIYHRPCSACVLWSESGAFAEHEIMPFEQFERRALAAALDYTGGGYQKTKIVITYENGDQHETRLDLAAGDCLGYTDYMEKRRQWLEQSPEQAAPYFPNGAADVAAALAEYADLDLPWGRLDIARTQAARATAQAEQAAEQARQAEQAAAADARAAKLEHYRTSPDFAHLEQIGQYTGATDVAKNIRRDLKKHFAGVKFSVRCSRGSSAINVGWTDGPTPAAVDAVIDRYQAGHFDGMTDSYEDNESAFCEVFGSVRYVFSDRDRSDALTALALAIACKNQPEPLTLEQYQTHPNTRINGENAGDLVHRIGQKLEQTAAGAWLYKGAPLQLEQPEPAPTPEPEQAPEPVAEPQASAEPTPQPQDKPAFKAAQVEPGIWRVTIEQGGRSAQYEQIPAASLAEACRIAWAIHSDPGEPEPDPDGPQGGEPAPAGRVVSLGDYRGRQSDRYHRIAGRAEKAQAASGQAYARAMAIGDRFWGGQPILIGHHSERRHRRDLERMDQAMRASVQNDDKARHYQRRADGVGTGGIASDDPAAVGLLRDKLQRLEAHQQAMKDANRMIRRTDPAGGLAGLGYTPEQIAELLKPGYGGRVGFADYELRNNGAEIRRVRQRLAEIERLHQAPALEASGQGWALFEDDGRICVQFDGKPPAEVRQQCKAAGFVWAPSRCAWVRKVTPAAVAAARGLIQGLPQ